MRKVVFSNGIPLRERGACFSHEESEDGEPSWQRYLWWFVSLMSRWSWDPFSSGISLSQMGGLICNQGHKIKKQTTQITRINTRVQNKDQYVSALTLLVSDLSWCNQWEGGFLKRPREGSSAPNQLPSGIFLYLSDDLCLNLVVEQTVRHTERHLALWWEPPTQKSKRLSWFGFLVLWFPVLWWKYILVCHVSLPTSSLCLFYCPFSICTCGSLVNPFLCIQARDFCVCV